MYKRVAVFRENLVSVIVSTFLIFMFVDRLLLVDVFSEVYYLTYAKKQQWRTSVIYLLNHEKSIISIWHSNLVYRFSPISVNFRLSAIPIFIDWLLGTYLIKMMFTRQHTILVHFNQIFFIWQSLFSLQIFTCLNCFLVRL